MAETKIKTITPEVHLQARGLFTIASMHYEKAREAELAMAELLGFDDGNYCGCVSDECVDGGDFDGGMKREGFVVKAKKKRVR